MQIRSYGLVSMVKNLRKKTSVIRFIIYFCALIKTTSKLKTNTTYNLQDTATAGGAFLCAAAPRRRPVIWQDEPLTMAPVSG